MNIYPDDHGQHDARAGKFLQWYRYTAHPQYRKVPYIPTSNIERADFDSAIRMAAELDDETMRKVAEFYLQIPRERERMLATGAYTVTRMLSLLPTIMEKMQ